MNNIKQTFDITLESMLSESELVRFKPGDWVIQEVENDRLGIAKITSEYDSTKEYLSVKRKGIADVGLDWQDVKTPRDLLELYMKIETTKTNPFSLDDVEFKELAAQLTISEFLTFDGRTYRLGISYE